MLIIFDLDDTLIDTSGSITPFKMRQCSQLLVKEGVCSGPFEKVYEELLSLNSVSCRSKDAILQFVSQKGCDASKAASSLSELSSPLPDGFVIATTPMAKEILQFFQCSHTLALVTGGSPRFQREKMEKAGLDSAIFSKIIISEDFVKKPGYEVLAQEFVKCPNQVWVCGDRIEMDLAPARELGFRTIHMRWGRGKHARADWIDHSISSLSELKGIIK